MREIGFVPGLPARRTVLRLLLAAPLGAALAGCGAAAPSATRAPATVAPAATAAPTPEARPAATAAPVASPVPPTQLRLGLPSLSFLSMPVYIAARQGYYRQAGVNVQITHIQATPTMVKGLIAGELDVTCSDPAAAIAAIAEGANLRLVGGWATLLHYFLAARKEVTSLRDLYGKSVGISQPGSLPDVVLRKLFEAEDLDIGQVDLVNVGGSSARAAALVSGKIVASTFSIDEADLVESDPNAHVLFYASEKLPRYVRSAIVVPGRLLASQSRAVEGFMRASLLGTRFTFDRPDDTKALATDVLQRSRAEIDRTYNYYAAMPLWDPDGLISPVKIDYMQQVNVDVGLQKSVVPRDRVLDQSPTERVLASIGRYEIKNKPSLPKTAG